MAPNAQPTPQPGSLWAGRYRLGAELGRGGVGVVFAAHDEQLDRDVAIKVLGPVTSEELAARFLREARAAARVQHPAVVELFDVGQNAGRTFLVIERLYGHDLCVRIREAGRLTPAFAMRIAAELARGLHAAHRLGVVHRDLKPQNVFLADMGQPFEVVKILDFGVAKLRGEEVLTSTNQVLGTPAYMAPEQLSDSKHVDERADVWSLGCLLFEMLTGEAPFRARSHQELVAQVLFDEPDYGLLAGLGLPDGLEALLRAALVRQPASQRPGANRFGRALTMMLGSQPLPAG